MVLNPALTFKILASKFKTDVTVCDIPVPLIPLRILILENFGSTFKTYIEMLDEGTLPSAGLPIMNRLLLDLFRE